MASEYQIEKILGEKRNEDDEIVYQIKWEGFGDNENTWEKRSELIEDGLEEEVLAYEKEVVKRKWKASNSGKEESKEDDEEEEKEEKEEVEEEEEEEEENEEKQGRRRARSKTPVRKSPKKKAEKSQQAKDAAVNEEQVEEKEQVEAKDADLSDLPIQTRTRTDSYSEVVPSISGWVLSLMFLVSVSTILRIFIDTDMKHLDPSVKKNLEIARLVIDPLPALVGTFAVFRQCVASMHCKLVSVALLWIGAMEYADKVFDVFPSQVSAVTSQVASKTVIILACVCMWEFLHWLSLMVDDIPQSHLINIVSVGGAAYVAKEFQQVAKVETAPLALQCAVLVLAFLSVGRAVSRVGYGSLSVMSSSALPQWLDLFSALLGISIVSIELLQLNGVINLDGMGEDFVLGQVPLEGVEHLRLNPIWLSFNLMKWGMVFGMTTAAILGHPIKKKVKNL